MYAWFKHPSIGWVSLLTHHYVNINLQAKKGQGIVSVIIYSMYMQPICQKYYLFQICDPLPIGPRSSILPQNLEKDRIFQNFWWECSLLLLFYRPALQSSFILKFFLWRPSVCRTKGWYTTPPFLEKLEYIAQKFLLQKKFQAKTILYSKRQHSIAKIATLVLFGLTNQYWHFFTELLYKKITAIL